MSVRKRTWQTKKGEESAWLVTYTDANGKRRFATFAKQKDAVDYHATVRVDVRRGVHVPPSQSETLAKAGKEWLDSCDGLERTSLDSYRQHFELHIRPYLGAMKLSQLTAPIIRNWQDKLRRGDPAPGQTEAQPRSADMVRRVTVSLGTLLASAQERGIVGHNAVRGLDERRKSSKKRQEKRKRGKLKIGVHIPEPAEINRIIKSAETLACEETKKGEKPRERWYPLLLIAIFCGLRASEIRGLRWQDVDFKKHELRVCQRADKYMVIGAPKSESSERTIPIPEKTLSVLRAWKVRCPPNDLDLVFPNGSGHIESHANIVHRGLAPTLIAAGVTARLKDAGGKPLRDDDGRPLVKAKYTGLHALRHFFASWCLNREKDGGRGMSLPILQELLGHKTIAMTVDRYGHLFPRDDDTAELDAAENALFG